MEKEIKYLTNCLFQEPWWLDIVAKDSWSSLEVKWGTEVVARMPYVLKSKFGIKKITQPSLTQVLGPTLNLGDGKPSTRLANHKKILNELIKQIPEFDIFSQNFHYSEANWLPFYWAGFEQTTRYTYIIENLEDLDLIWSNFQSNIKTDIKKAERLVKVDDDFPVKDFIKICEKTFRRQGSELPYSSEILLDLDAECSKKGCKKIFAAIDSIGNIHSAIYIVWDDRSAYYLMAGSDPKFRNSGANSLLIWEAIKFSSLVTKKFDFEGSMIEPIEKFFRAFGATQVPYFHISKKSKRYKFISNLKEMLNFF